MNPLLESALEYYLKYIHSEITYLLDDGVFDEDNCNCDPEQIAELLQKIQERLDEMLNHPLDWAEKDRAFAEKVDSALITLLGQLGDFGEYWSDTKLTGIEKALRR